MLRHPSKASSSHKASMGEIVKEGNLKKLKARASIITMRKKYFVLRGDAPDNPARLEYYDSEKKFKSNNSPKRTIILKTCFNINKKSDTKQKYVIALHTKNDCLSIVLDSEEEMENWLKAMLELQFGEAAPEGDPIRPNFEHVWQVTVCERDLGARLGILGPYRLCLTDQILSLVGPITEEKMNSYDFSLQKIKSCGATENFFYLQVGSCTVTGAGNLFMAADDKNIAENIHTTIHNAFTKFPKKDDLSQTKMRYRSSSANEASKPITPIQRWPTHTASSGSSGGGGSGGLGVNHQRTYSFPLSPIPPTRRASTGTRPTKFITSTSPQSSLTGVRERSDSMPSRARTTSECGPHHPNSRNFNSCQIRQHNNRCISYSPPVASSPLSPASVACSTDSAGSSLSMDGDTIDGQWEDTRYCHSLTPDEQAILEENSDDYSNWPGIKEDEKLNNYMHSEHFNHNIDAYRKNTMTLKSNSPSQGSYLDSPCGSSPLETGNYLTMSPAENRGNNYGRNMIINHSRGSSLADDGYVPMAPQASDDGYVNMDHGSNRNKSNKYRYPSGELSTGSSCSITSGTPSTDIRFSEYPLDKVTSYLIAEDEVTSNDRPVRAYSVGSRPSNNKNRSEILVNNTCERTRAFSVGSKNARPTNNLRLLMINHQPLSSSHSSVEPSDDMMVLDFTKKSRFRLRKKPSSNERLSVPGGSVSTLSSTTSSYSTAEGSYIDMSSPRISPSLAPSPPKTSRFAQLLGKSPPNSINKSSPPVTVSGYPSPSLGRVPEAEPGYVEMTVGSDSHLYPTKNKNNNREDGYVHMKPLNGEIVVAKNTNKPRVETFPTIEPVKNTTFKPKDEYLDMSLKRKIPLEDNNNSKVVNNFKTQTDDYVEMNLGSKPKKYSGDDESDYLNMTGGRKKEKDRFISQPITIQSNKDGSLNMIYSVAGRKLSTGTSPQVPSYLPLGISSSPVTSPGSSRTRQRTRRESKESVTTPTMFPLSLNSPVSVESYESSPKCPVDGTGGNIRLYDTHSENDLSTLMRDESDYVNYDPNGSNDDYIPMQPGVFPTSKCRKTSAPTIGTKLRPLEKLLSGLGTEFNSLSMTSTPCPPSPVNSESDSSTLDSNLIIEEEKAESRKSSLTGDKELHYASLDLMRSGSESEDSNKTLKTQTSLNESSGSSPSPNLTSEASSFNYAEIDFVKSGSTQKTIH